MYALADAKEEKKQKIGDAGPGGKKESKGREAQRVGEQAEEALVDALFTPLSMEASGL